MIASSLASRIVYREGLQYIEGLADATLPQLCLRYMQEANPNPNLRPNPNPNPNRNLSPSPSPDPNPTLRDMQEEKRVRELAEELGASGLENAEQMKELLLQGGVRAAVERGL